MADTMKHVITHRRHPPKRRPRHVVPFGILGAEQLLIETHGCHARPRPATWFWRVAHVWRLRDDSPAARAISRTLTAGWPCKGESDILPVPKTVPSARAISAYQQRGARGRRLAILPAAR